MLRNELVSKDKPQRTIPREGSIKTKRPKGNLKKLKDISILPISIIEGTMMTSLKTTKSFSQKNHSLMFRLREVNQEDSRNLGSALVLNKLMNLVK